MANQHHRAFNRVEDLLCGRDVSRERLGGILYGDHLVASIKQDRDHPLPAGAVGPGAVYENDGGGGGRHGLTP